MAPIDYWKGIDRKFRLPRIWSNNELKKFAPFFKGNVANISAWQDQDKEGKRYQEYFVNASSYTITNYKSEARGFQGLEGEIFLDLTGDLDPHLFHKFDVVFNHTVLEHIYSVHKAFSNLCAMSKDVVILVVPFLQEMHGKYGDYWRFTPLTLKALFEENGFEILYLSFNSHTNASVYIFAIGSRNINEWKNRIPVHFDYVDRNVAMSDFEGWIGCNAIQNDQYNKGRKVGPSKFIGRFINSLKQLLGYFF